MKKFIPTKAYLFDFDGTLVDTMHGYADIAGRLISGRYGTMSFEEGRRRYIETSGVPFCQQIEIIYPGDARNDETVRMFEDEKLQGFYASHFDPEVAKALASMRAKGFLIGVSSGNFPDLIDEYVKREGVVFDIVMGYEHERGFEKGAPHFDYFLKEFSLFKSDLTFVGDSLKDADKGYDYGVQFVGMTGLFSAADFRNRHADCITCDSIMELDSLCIKEK
jgi:phosphoglycolate phosphatase-like HAD superfamily hydrolase